ncbi:hypothetical protein GJ744_002011 [Endocarpon pusillum]|uniref:Prion-inhibition and propagation HeLo domain-containing protein n=1 Tax=Endocarpon pusillum TaxID=364733 RepID=A0A8H7E0A2_9EURO|nr:hypothetical protein GJ744_002011 [Endocarpon pusillum]
MAHHSITSTFTGSGNQGLQVGQNSYNRLCLCHHHSSSAGKDAVTQVVLLKYQQTRFLVWGQSLDIFGSGIISDRVSDPVRETIIATLVQIRALIGDAEQIVARCRLERSGDTTPVEPQIWAREVDKQANFVQKVQTSCSLARHMRWAIHDHARFANLVSQLTTLNDVLYQFCPVNQRLSLPTAVTAETLARTFTEEGHEGVRLLQRAAVGAERPFLQDVGNRTTAFLDGSDREAAKSLTFGPSRRPQLDKCLFIDVHQL